MQPGSPRIPQPHRPHRGARPVRGTVHNDTVNNPGPTNSPRHMPTNGCVALNRDRGDSPEHGHGSKQTCDNPKETHTGSIPDGRDRREKLGPECLQAAAAAPLLCCAI